MVYRTSANGKLILRSDQFLCLNIIKGFIFPPRLSPLHTKRLSVLPDLLESVVEVMAPTVLLEAIVMTIADETIKREALLAITNHVSLVSVAVLLEIRYVSHPQ